MSDNELKTDGRGSFAISQWADIKRSGGTAPSPQEIDNIFNRGGDSVTLTRQEVQDIITNYFKSCVTLVTDETGETNYIWKTNPTKTGLAISLGVSTDTLVDYTKGIDGHGNVYKLQGSKSRQRVATADFDLIKQAYSLVESFYESKLGENRNNSGSIFWLLNSQNSRWSNTQEVSIDTTNHTQQLTASQLPRLGTIEMLEQDETPHTAKVLTGADLPKL